MDEYNNETKEDLVLELIKLKSEVEHLSSHILEHSISSPDPKFQDEFKTELPEAIFEANLKGQFTYVNKAAFKLFGYPADYNPGKLSIADVISPEDVERAQENFKKLIFNKELGSNEYTAIRADGNKFLVIIHSAPVKSRNTVVGVRGLIVDITNIKSAELALRQNNKMLEDTVYERTKELEETNKKLLRSVEQTIKALAQTVAQRDPYTANHQERVAHLAQTIGARLGLGPEQLKCVYLAGIIHDIGKIHIPSEILCKPTRLTDLEFELIKTHSERGFEILQNIEFPWPIDRTLLQHHEKIDGSGYPHGLKGNEILIEAKILTVADVVEAVSSHRPYRPALGVDKALKIIKEGQNTLFDPQIVDICHSLFLEEGYNFVK